MNANQRLMCVLAHPDDESLGMGGTLAKYARQGVYTAILTATKGERGRYGLSQSSPAPEVVGKAREQELLNAAGVLGVSEVKFLNYLDGDLDRARPEEIITAIGLHLRRVRPQVVITFGPEGAYGHPDHIAISQFTTAATVRAADPAFATPGYLPHAVLKLYYLAWPAAKWEAYQTAFKTLSSLVDGVRRTVNPYPDWAITTRIDATEYWETAWQAILCHQTQMAIYENLNQLPLEQHQSLWGKQEFYRAYSLVNGGREVETDLFEGINPKDKAPNPLKIV